MNQNGVLLKSPLAVPPGTKVEAGASDHLLAEVLKRCPAETLEAARQFQRNRDAVVVPVIVRGVIARHVDRERQRVLQPPRSDLRLVEDLGLDSLSLIEISITLEDVFNVPVREDQMRHLQTLGEVERYTAEHLAAGPARV